MSKQLGGRHQQRGTGRWFDYHVFYVEIDDDAVYYLSAIDEGFRGHPGDEAAITFDPEMMSADEAARADVCRYIDNTVFGEGREFRLPTHKGKFFG